MWQWQIYECCYFSKGLFLWIWRLRNVMRAWYDFWGRILVQRQLHPPPFSLKSHLQILWPEKMKSKLWWCMLNQHPSHLLLLFKMGKKIARKTELLLQPLLRRKWFHQKPTWSYKELPTKKGTKPLGQQPFLLQNHGGHIRWYCRKILRKAWKSGGEIVNMC